MIVADDPNPGLSTDLDERERRRQTARKLEGGADEDERCSVDGYRGVEER